MKLCFSLLFLSIANGLTIPNPGNAAVEFFGTSGPITGMTEKPQKPFTQDKREVPLFPPRPPQAENIVPAPGALDGALDDGSGASGMPAPIQNFPGINVETDVTRQFVPPDTVGDVGPNHYVQMVNTAFAIYDKSGNVILPAQEIDVLFAGVPECESGGGDPIVLYDQFEDRWFLTQLTIGCLFSTAPCYNCIAVSTSGDPTSSYYLYRIQAQDDPDGVWPSVLPDYPKYSLWSDTLVLTTRDFGGGSYFGTSIYALEKAPLITGAGVNGFQYTLEQSIYGSLIGDGLHLLAADVDGAELPPPGSPIPIVSSQDDNFGAPSDALNVWDLFVDWTVPGGSVNLLLPVQLPVAEFDSNVCGLFCREEISQPITTQKLDSIGYSLLHRLAYRNFGSYESMVVVRGGVKRAGNGSPLGVRWFEIRRDTSGSYTVHQESTFSPDDGITRWMGSIAQDHVGNIAMGYSVVGANVFPGIRYAGRLAGDDLGTMSLGEQSLIEGSAYQEGLFRWGDYSSMNIDPTDDCTFWYTTEYYDDNGGSPNRELFWQTRIGSFVLPGCKSPPNDLCANPRELGTLTATEAPFNVIGTTVGATVDDGFDSPCSDETMITAPGVWYTFESDLPCILASTCGDYTNYDTQISVYAGDNCDNLVCVDGNDDGGGECELKSFTGPFPAETMTRYYVLVHGFGSGEGDFSLVLSAAIGCQTPEPTKEPTKEPAKQAPKSTKGSKSKSSKSPKSTKNSKSKKIYRNLRNGYDH